MATNLLIGYSDIPAASVSTSINNAASSMYPYANLFGGNKTDMMYLASAASGDTRLSFALASGQTKTADFLYIGRANLLQNKSVDTITLKANSSNDYATATTVTSVNSFTSQTLYGPNDDDFIATFSESSAYRYWYVNYNATAASTVPHAKLFFGKAFDPGIDPNAPATITRLRTGGAQRRSTFTFEFSWEGMSYQKAVLLYTTFYRTRRYVPIVIFTRDWHDILMGKRAVFCRITNMQLPPRITDYCNVTATFEEIP